ncbi:MAG: hypothetical protein HYU81_00475 [Candidatus Brennerbacteria bacterium]|nr:hypothetical protein [Candidatus Brennerbacteria bacterium]
MLVALASIGVITAFVWFLNGQKFFPIAVCPICAGTAGTWLWILAGALSGLLSPAAYMPVAGILMGGSAVGIAYQGEKYLRVGRVAFLWKAFFVPIGFGTAWSVTHFAFGLAIFGVLALLALAGFFLELRKHQNGDPDEVSSRKGNVGYLEKEMENCC